MYLQCTYTYTRTSVSPPVSHAPVIYHAFISFWCPYRCIGFPCSVQGHAAFTFMVKLHMYSYVHIHMCVPSSISHAPVILHVVIDVLIEAWAFLAVYKYMHRLLYRESATHVQVYASGYICVAVHYCVVHTSCSREIPLCCLCCHDLLYTYNI